MTRFLMALTVALLLCPAVAEVIWQDDFSQPARYEFHGPRCWTLGGGKCAFRAAGDAILATLTPPLEQATLEADLTVDQRIGTSWTLAGLVLFSDSSNHWRLLMVEGPTGQRYFELIEMLAGVHQAQTGVGSPAERLEPANSGKLQTWDYGKPYHLTLTVSPKEISGRITDPATGEFWQRTYSFARGTAVKSGRAALQASGTTGAFRSLQVDAAPPALTQTAAVKAGPAGTVAILRDEAGAVAGALAKAFEGAGYGVTLLAWEDLEAAHLPWAKLDLLVLADARRVAVRARDEVMAALQSQGKVMAVGAPAFSRLLVQTPAGWRGSDAWLEAYASRLVRTPLSLTAADWQRTAFEMNRAGSITPDPAEGPGCWKIASDFKGWDGYSVHLSNGFGPGRELLVFEAKGDAQTSQMVVECTEKDHSRWIATVDLTPGWRTVMLRPEDFPYWNDSDAKGRGGPGDHLRPENVDHMMLGLAGSHNPRVEPGPHALWLRNLSTAPRGDLPQPNFQVPEIEALCPSYKLYPMDQVARLRPVGGGATVPWAHPAYSPVWRQEGRGFNRGRPWRWVPTLEAFDAAGRPRGALISTMIGDGVAPNAVWANVAVAEPAQALEPPLLAEVLRTARRMTQGTFLLEGGAELFSYLPGEAVALGARALNTSREPRSLTLALRVTDAGGREAFSRQAEVRIAPGRAAGASWQWKPVRFDPRGYTVTARLVEKGEVTDSISHRLEALRATPARPEEFVRVEGSRFMLGGKPWYFKGVNYYPTWIGGYPGLAPFDRECYDPQILERDLDTMQSMGINALSAIACGGPPDASDPWGFRDLRDFLDRCSRHGMKVHCFVPNGRPYQGADVEKIKDYITRAGIKDHPAIISWGLAWEPIEGAWGNGLEFLVPDWNAWVVERYGSAAAALADWGFKPQLTPEGKLPAPTGDQCSRHGPWDRYVAAFRRAFSDLLSARYRDIAEPLRAWDPKHLISFRGGACGIPNQQAFAHIHSVGVAKHLDYLCPEGYDLMTGGWTGHTPPEDLRKGGLVTLYYRTVSREKPVVWMEFGLTVNGIYGTWTPESVRVKPEKLAEQREAYEAYYAMFVESGARGAAPWWLPGGFRLGENSDFGLLEPDGAERPVCQVLRQYLPEFDRVQHPAPTRIIPLDLDAHYADAWATYAPQYLDAVKAHQTPGLRTAGAGTTSATCPLTAVGGGPYNGHNPPQFLNAEFNRLELKVGDAPWREVRGGESLDVPRGAKVLCRASVGNLGEARWLAPTGPAQAGGVYLAGRREYGLEFTAPITADADYLKDATVAEFALPAPATVSGAVTASFEMTALGRAFFGERRTVTLKPLM